MVAIVAAGVGVFTVIRGQSFAGEALGDIGAAGGSAPSWSASARSGASSRSSLAAAGAMELIGIQRARGRDLATGIVLGAGFGLAALFLYLGTIDDEHDRRDDHDPVRLDLRARPRRCCRWSLVLGALALGTLVALYRPLLLSSVSPELAAARGIPVRLVGALYLLAHGASRSRSPRSRSGRSSPPRC